MENIKAREEHVKSMFWIENMAIDLVLKTEIKDRKDILNI